MTRVERTRRVKRVTAIKTAVLMAGIFAAGIMLTAQEEAQAPKYQAPVIVERPAPAMVLEYVAPVEQEASVEEIVLAKTIWGEARGCSKDQQAAVVWCILNRVDDSRWADDIIGVATAPKQFHGYAAGNPVDPELVELARDVMGRWQAEKMGRQDVGRVLPREYVYFWGDGEVNHYTTEYQSGTEWGWTAWSPYEVMA